jgi:hypothetical protein
MKTVRRIRHASMLLAAVAGITAPAASAGRDVDLSGHYRVRGECAYRTEDGEYRDCVAWNTLDLARDAVPGRYRYALETATFATTAGGCAMDGLLQESVVAGERRLVAIPDEENRCPLRFVERARSLVLEVDDAPDSEPACRKFCGYNSSLYSDPFPLRSRRRP